MKVRFFGTSGCRVCLELFVLLNQYQIEYEYIDALEDDEDIQEFCDDHNVDDLPHIQWIDDDDAIVAENIGKLSEKDLMGIMSDYFPNY